MPSMPVELLPIAEDDVSQALVYIAAEDPGAAGRRRYRQLYVRPYHIYYRVIEEKIVVMRVLHERMDIRRHLP